jgi:hypothetical protein
MQPWEGSVLVVERHHDGKPARHAAGAVCAGICRRLLVAAHG